MEPDHAAPAEFAASALADLERRMLLAEAHADLNRVHPDRAASARNLVHYLALRESDARPLQDRLRTLGLSSLGRAEGCTLATVRAARRAAAALARLEAPDDDPPDPVSINQADALRESSALASLGPAPEARRTRIMVTLPAESADDPRVARTLLEAGMDLARINAAHDGPDAWAAMIEHLRAAERELDRPPTRIHLDLAGPNPRTAPADAKRPRLREGERVLLCGPEPNRTDAPPHDHEIVCTLPEVLAHAQPGHRVYFDDGRIVCVVDRTAPGALVLRVTDAGPAGVKLGPGKGINLPDTPLHLPSLMPADLAALRFVATRSDIELVGLSFVRSADDVRACLRHLPGSVALAVKIETREGFDNLPEILLAQLARPASAVMIARGDLAVEVGVERLAEAQEEILWLCEAAHIPVIWATQVLERLAKKGRASRAEVTDAAMAGRAECVMLNKGPHIARAVRTLDDILRRMQDHQSKKRAMLRPLGLARRFAMRSGA
ncbi:MAG: pyruvate kinase [Phycisphaerales bacterium]